ncbi:MAG: hypothetical protein HY581_00240 [Nitrospirae bacterium]|nr:hypothetical protein [Nitrospirota bacterium]
MALDPQGLNRPGLDPKLLAEFRARLKQAREANPDAWEASRRLVRQPAVQSTLKRLAAAIERAASLSPPLRDALLSGLCGGAADRVQTLPAEILKQLTGLSPTKAVRVLCVLFGLTADETSTAPVSTLTPAEVEQFVRVNPNPFDLLLAAEVSTLLDLGAGDLTFAVELIEQYLPRLRAQHKELTLHCVDRLQPGSKLGGLYHADRARLETLQRNPSPGLQFQYWGNQDMCALERVKQIRPRYTIVTCHAPATPTFAYEPTRVSRPIIEAHLRKTKGEFRKVRANGEEALEVHHAGRTLMFPPWKFEVRGPLALLDLLSRRGKLGVLAAVDTEVFWEVLSQLMEDERVRPPEVIFNGARVATLFGAVHARLSSLAVGGSVVLSDVTHLRRAIPRVLEPPGTPGRFYRFRYVEVRRGAVFEGIPAGRTARLFKDMTQEAPPWFLILVPDEP